MMKRATLVTVFVLFVLTLAPLHPVLSQAPQGDTAKCQSLTTIDAKRLPNNTTAIRSAVLNAASAAKGKNPAYPDHCEVLGAMNERTGANGQRYAIKFHLRLPSAWNGKSFFEGGGGSNGNLGTAFGNLQGQQRTTALMQGYAVVSQDAGHDNAVNNDPQRNGTATFGFDPQARIDHSYNSYDQVTQVSKAIVQTYYGRAPERSYFAGCSEGGREAMLMAQRYPNYYDGILACAPGFNIPKVARFGETWDTQAIAEVAKAMGIYDRTGQPFLNKTFTDEDLELVSQAVLGACDRLDNLEDGIIDNFMACTSEVVLPKLQALKCKDPKRVTCLAAAQVAALEKIFAGGKNSKGELLYSDWAWDRGIGGRIGDNFNQGWRVWKMGPFDGAVNNAINVTLGGVALAALSTPPVVVATPGPGALSNLLAIDVERASEGFFAESPEFPRSVASMMTADSTDLSAFRNRGGKLVIVHGVSDPIFSIKDSIRWWAAVDKANNGGAAAFVRLFGVPGMNHCAGGPGTDQFDAFGALVAWVEKNAAPERIEATAGPATPWPGRTRPLCSYPKQARYRGTGSIEQAASFACE